jgi:hypothetical protein
VFGNDIHTSLLKLISDVYTILLLKVVFNIR